MTYKTLHTKLFGTNIKISIYHNNPDPILSTCEMLLTYYHKLLSFYDDESIISKINQNAGIKSIQVDDETFKLIQSGKLHSLEEKSNLNICLGPLVKLWDIGFDSAKVPSDGKLNQALKHTDPNNLILDKYTNNVYLSKKGMSINLGAIAKGFIADALLTYLKEQGIISAIIDLGGNILTHGFNLKSPTLNWRIGLQNPLEKRGIHLTTLELNDLSIVTSGVYERKSIVNGNAYHHIINPKTGRPLNTNMLSLSIISKESLNADIYSTMYFGIPFDEIELASKDKGFDAIAIYKGNILRYTKGCRKFRRDEC